MDVLQVVTLPVPRAEVRALEPVAEPVLEVVHAQPGLVPAPRVVQLDLPRPRPTSG